MMSYEYNIFAWLWCQGKGQGITKVIRLDPLGTMRVLVQNFLEIMPAGPSMFHDCQEGLKMPFSLICGVMILLMIFNLSKII